MDKKKLLLSGLTVAGFLAAAGLSGLTFAGDETVPPATGDQKTEGKKGSCSGGSCGAMKDKDKKEAQGTAEAKGKEGSCNGMKDEGKTTDEKEEGKKGSCTAMK